MAITTGGRASLEVTRFALMASSCAAG